MDLTAWGTAKPPTPHIHECKWLHLVTISDLMGLTQNKGPSWYGSCWRSPVHELIVWPIHCRTRVGQCRSDISSITWRVVTELHCLSVWWQSSKRQKFSGVLVSRQLHQNLFPVLSLQNNRLPVNWRLVNKKKIHVSAARCLILTTDAPSSLNTFTLVTVA